MTRKAFFSFLKEVYFFIFFLILFAPVSFSPLLYESFISTFLKALIVCYHSRGTMKLKVVNSSVKPHLIKFNAIPSVALKL